MTGGPYTSGFGTGFEASKELLAVGSCTRDGGTNLEPFCSRRNPFCDASVDVESWNITQPAQDPDAVEQGRRNLGRLSQM